MKILELVYNHDVKTPQPKEKEEELVYKMYLLSAGAKYINKRN